MNTLTVLDAGPSALIEDLGRPGYAAIGVARSGAFDRAALQLANRLVGNPDDAAGIEALGGGLKIAFEHDALVALTGANGPFECNETACRRWAPVAVPAGAVVEIGRPVTGLRSYLAVRGGLLADEVLGSRSTDPVTGLGPAVLTAGSTVPIGTPTGLIPHAPDGLGGGVARVGDLIVRAWWGPRDDWLTAEAHRLLAETRWLVGTASDRVGVRLEGPQLARANRSELPSEGVFRGGIQVPPSGQPLVFGPDHPTTGGYPVTAVVLDDDVDLLAQVRPGDGVRFDLRRR